ncbi:MAG: hypothetical protein ACI4MC_02105 [Candidatus Coproplasma sp.]
MIRRPLRTLRSLSKSLSRVTVVGGEEDYGELSFGFYDDGNGLKTCPAPDSRYIYALFNTGFYAAKRYDFCGINLYLYTTGAALIYEKGGTLEKFVTLPEGDPFAAEARNEDGDSLLVLVCGDGMCVYNGVTEEKTVTTLPSPLYGGIVHCGRLFAADKSSGYKVVWSGLRVTDWEDGVQGSGYILLDGELGKVLKLESFGDDILCVRERGFTVIRAMADSRNFRIAPSQCSVDVGLKINVGGAIGKKYYFTSSGALYCYDGSSVSLEYSAGGKLAGLFRAYAFGDGYVYAECDYNDRYCLMRYDPHSGKAIFFGEDCTSPFMLNGQLLCKKNLNFYGITSAGKLDNRLWRSVPIACGRKTLKNLSVESDGEPVITVVCGDYRRTFTGTGKIPVNLSGEEIFIEISGNASVRRVTAELEERK